MTMRGENKSIDMLRPLSMLRPFSAIAVSRYTVFLRLLYGFR